MRIIKDFDKIGKVPYDKKRSEHELNDSYFYLVRQLAKCMTRSDKLNWHDHGSYTETTAPSANVNFTDKDESRETIVQETLSDNNSKGVSE